MKREDVKRMLLWLEGFYPNMNNHHHETGRMSHKISAWYDVLYLVKKADAARILKSYVKTESRPPTIADIMRPWQKSNSGKDMDEWNKYHGIKGEKNEKR